MYRWRVARCLPADLPRIENRGLYRANLIDIQSEESGREHLRWYAGLET